MGGVSGSIIFTKRLPTIKMGSELFACDYHCLPSLFTVRIQFTPYNILFSMPLVLSFKDKTSGRQHMMWTVLWIIALHLFHVIQCTTPTDDVRLALSTKHVRQVYEINNRGKMYEKYEKVRLNHVVLLQYMYRQFGEVY